MLMTLKRAVVFNKNHGKPQRRQNKQACYFMTKQSNVYIGSDHLGNEYYEKIGDSERNVRSQRFIKEKSGSSPQDIPDVPVEWDGELRNFKSYMSENNRYLHWNLPKPNSLTETIISNNPKTPFPKYEEFEDSPGQKYNKEGNKIS
ncbi:hypothetical protein ElyMa_002341800 [Elysia marginata]|uniref:Uncharacterized protein n=1 Tax=Elysia marginata TaxID=1093978 RepID=A0AAV4G8W7_9GAST|nr:hypothetical protein ElyMa_002341800 [Elysia marginata]